MTTTADSRAEHFAKKCDEYARLIRQANDRITALETSLEAERTLRLCVHDEWQEAESELKEANARIDELTAIRDASSARIASDAEIINAYGTEVDGLRAKYLTAEKRIAELEAALPRPGSLEFAGGVLRANGYGPAANRLDVNASVIRKAQGGER